MRLVEQGHEFTVTRHGSPVAKLVSIANSSPIDRTKPNKHLYRHPMRQATRPSAEVLNELRQERN